MGAARNLSVVSGGTFVCPAETILYICQAAKFLRDERGGRGFRRKALPDARTPDSKSSHAFPIFPLFLKAAKGKGIARRTTPSLLNLVFYDVPWQSMSDIISPWN